MRGGEAALAGGPQARGPAQLSGPLRLQLLRARLHTCVLLDAPLQHIIDRGELVPDHMVLDALLEVILNPEVGGGGGGGGGGGWGSLGACEALDWAGPGSCGQRGGTRGWLAWLLLLLLRYHPGLHAALLLRYHPGLHAALLLPPRPQTNDGAGLVIDGFPRTALQVDFVKLLHDKLMALGLQHADTPEEWRFPRPSFKARAPCCCACLLRLAAALGCGCRACLWPRCRRPAAGPPLSPVAVCCSLAFCVSLPCTRTSTEPPTRPTLHAPTHPQVVILYVDEEESVRRQMRRAQLAAMHNKRVMDAGTGDVWDVRTTDVNEALCRRRYQVRAGWAPRPAGCWRLKGGGVPHRHRCAAAQPSARLRRARLLPSLPACLPAGLQGARPLPQAASSPLFAAVYFGPVSRLPWRSCCAV